MSFKSEVVRQTLLALKNGFTPSVRPACADFTSTMLRRAGSDISHITYVPNLVPLGKKVAKPEEGDVVIFDRTYDAMLPPGIGAEDDMTHVGVMVSTTEFVHYSASQDKPVRAKLADWKDKINCFLDFDKSKNEGKTIKLFHNKNGTKIIIDGQEYKCASIEAYIKTEE